MNWHYAFWNTYYEGLAWNGEEFINPGIKRKNELFTMQTWEDGEVLIPMPGQSFTMEVQYPGLISGIGLTHDSGSISRQDRALPEAGKAALIAAIPFCQSTRAGRRTGWQQPIRPHPPEAAMINGFRSSLPDPGKTDPVMRKAR